MTLFSLRNSRWQLWGVGRGELRGLTKHPPAVLAQDAGQVLLALGTFMPVWGNHGAWGRWSGHDWAPNAGREMAEC